MRLFLTLFALSVLLLARSSAASPLPIQDILVGNGTPGPYPLSWSHIQPGTESVQINGLTQLRGLDYTLDTDTGAVTFTRALPAQSAAEITYERDPIQAQRNGAGQTIPLSLDLLRGPHGYFSLNALGTTGDSAGNGLTLGLGMGLSGGANTQLTTHFFYAPVTAASETDNQSAEKRMGLAVAGSAGAGGWGLFSFGFSRAGVGLGDVGDSSLSTGKQTFTLGSHLTPMRQLEARILYSQSMPTDGSPTGETASTSLALTLTPSDKAQVQANFAQSATSGSGRTQTLDLSVTAQPTDKMQVSAAYNSVDVPGTASDSQGINLKSVLTPSKTLSLERDAGQTRLGTATTDQQAVSVSLTPRPALQLSAGLALRQKAADGQDTLGTAVASVSGTLKPFSFLEVSGSYKSRMAPVTDTDPNDLFDTSAATVAFSPLKSVRLVGTYAQNPEDGANALQRLAKRGVGLETTLGALGLSGGCDWSRAYDTPDVEQTIHADLGLRFSAATQLSVGFQTQQSQLDAFALPATAYTVGFTHSLGDRFSLSLNGKRQQSTAAQADYNATANLGMKF